MGIETMEPMLDEVEPNDSSDPNEVARKKIAGIVAIWQNQISDGDTLQKAVVESINPWKIGPEMADRIFEFNKFFSFNDDPKSSLIVEKNLDANSQRSVDLLELATQLELLDRTNEDHSKKLLTSSEVAACGFMRQFMLSEVIRIRRQRREQEKQEHENQDDWSFRRAA